MKQILSGVAHMHAIGFFHADLHPGNVMVQRNPPKATIRNFGFTDFGRTKDAQKCGVILQMMDEAVGRMGTQAQRLIESLKGGSISAAEALNHAWFQKALSKNK